MRKLIFLLILPALATPALAQAVSSAGGSAAPPPQAASATPFDLWDVVTKVGSLVALLTAAFIVYDRLIQQRPLIYFAPSPLGGIGRRTVYLRIRNIGEQPIIVHLPAAVPGGFGIAADHSADAIVSSMVRDEVGVSVEGNETKNLVIIRPENFDTLDKEHRITMRLAWQSARYRWWGIRWPLWVSITKANWTTLEKQKSTGGD